MSASKKTYRLAAKYGMVKRQNGGHGGSRGNGQHLVGKKEGSEMSRREESRTKREIQKDQA